MPPPPPPTKKTNLPWCVGIINVLPAASYFFVNVTGIKQLVKQLSNYKKYETSVFEQYFILFWYKSDRQTVKITNTFNDQIIQSKIKFSKMLINTFFIPLFISTNRSKMSYNKSRSVEAASSKSSYIRNYYESSRQFTNTFMIRIR